MSELLKNVQIDEETGLIYPVGYAVIVYAKSRKKAILHAAVDEKYDVKNEDPKVVVKLATERFICFKDSSTYNYFKGLNPEFIATRKE